MTVEFSIKNGNAAKVYESHKLSTAAQEIDAVSNGLITQVIERGDMDGKLDATLILHHVPGVMCERILLVGLGKEEEFAEKQYCKAVRAGVKALGKSGANNVTSFLAELPVRELVFFFILGLTRRSTDQPRGWCCPCKLFKRSRAMWV